LERAVAVPRRPAGLVDGGRATTEHIEGGGQALGFELAALELGARVSGK
jgi:hypothetical protein